MLTLLAVFGIMSGLFLYEYTDFFDLLKDQILITDKEIGNIEIFFSLYYEEIKLLGLLFICGCTLFSPYISGVLLVYKGFMTGFSTLFFGMQYHNGAFMANEFRINCILLILNLVIFVIMAAKSMLFSSMLRYAAPDIKTLISQKMTKRYILTFLLMSGFLALSTAVRYILPYILR